MNSRVNYIDNLRTAIVSLLIIYHLGIAYNSWGEANYIFFERVNFIVSIVVFISPWFMRFKKNEINKEEKAVEVLATRSKISSLHLRGIYE